MLDMQNITVGYGEETVLRDVSLTIRRSSVVALLGANGAGKTTLLKTLNGTIKPEKGQIFLDGKELNMFSRSEIARQIAVVAQENETKFPVSVLEFVLAGRFAHGGAFGWETDADIQVAEAALNECDLLQFSGRPMNELSGGERQRVVLARALASESKILLLDEPTANIDLEHQGTMFRLVRRRCRDEGYSAVIITHDLNLAAEFANEVVLLRDGKVFGEGEPKDVLTAENLQSVFAVRVLLDANPASGNVRVTTVY